MKKTSMSNSVESFGYINCYSSSSPTPVKYPSNSIRCNCQKIWSWSRPKSILEIRKKAIFLQVVNNPIIYKIFKDLTNHREQTNWAIVFSSRTSPNIFKYRDHQWDLPTTWKRDSFRQILESSASMFEISGSQSQFFRTTTEIQSGPDAFDESRFIMTFLTILGVIEILWSFRLVLEGKIGKEIPESSRLKFLEKFLVNSFALSDAEDNTSWPLSLYIWVPWFEAKKDS